MESKVTSRRWTRRVAGHSVTPANPGVRGWRKRCQGRKFKARASMAGPLGSGWTGDSPMRTWSAAAGFEVGVLKGWAKDRSTMAAHTQWQEGRPPFREVCSSPSRSPRAAGETCASAAC